MTKSNIKAADIDIYFQYVSDCINNKKYWKVKKKWIKALKLYKKNNIDMLYRQSKDDNKHSENLLVKLNDWCKQCLNTKKLENLKQTLNPNFEPQKVAKEVKKVKLTNKIYELLNDVAEQENISVSQLIASMLENKVANLNHQNNDNKITQLPNEVKNNTPNEEPLLTYEIVKKDNEDMIDLCPYAGGQCQALSQTTKKRCKKITPDLLIKHQKIGDIMYEFCVCQTHNKETSQLDPNYIKVSLG